MHHDQMFRTERTLPFSPQTVYNAFASAEVLATWWGPDGFTNEFETFEFQVGGRWIFVMVGPDGARYPNQSVFTALEPGLRVVIRHDCEPFSHFRCNSLQLTMARMCCGSKSSMTCRLLGLFECVWGLPMSRI